MKTASFLTEAEELTRDEFKIKGDSRLHLIGLDALDAPEFMPAGSTHSYKTMFGDFFSIPTSFNREEF